MYHHLSRNYRIISVMFWAFPYLLWQAFGHWSGFLVGVLVAVILTTMLNSLFREGSWNTVSSAGRRSFQTAEPEAQRQEAKVYQRGYRTETEPYRVEPQLYQAEGLPSRYEEEEMEVPYPQEEMPPMEQIATQDRL